MGTECKCLDPNYTPPTTTTPACEITDYKGDNNCDDENNKKSCDWDGGDCCGQGFSKKYCKKCKCLDPNPPTTTSKPACGGPAFKADKHCDDDNNYKSCDWDGGDCCGPDVIKHYCEECKCLDPNPPTTTKRPDCGSPKFNKDVH